MALIIEDGTAKADAQSYATVAELRAYATLRGKTVPAADADCEALLIKAMDSIESNEFIGDRLTETQALAWPRANAVVERWPIATTQIPRQLVQAQCALAIEAQTVNLLPTKDINWRGARSAESVAGAVSVAYVNDGRVRNVPAVASARALLRLLLRNSGLTLIRA